MESPGSVPPKSELRARAREAVGGSVSVLCPDGSGGERMLSAKLLNASASGLLLKMDRPLPVRSSVLCNNSKLGINGRGLVRYCRMVKGGYEVGLEFGGGTGFSSPQKG